ncbi:hypothetical protein GEV33_002979 [Tenebrio molitor]|uniref:Glucosylceramidase n=1 Tax=Tenebrio molitor TaxID=7067 RepID=A0A8J6HSF7_TENMO|nr:hypothetical protein GEV33_002979 [Tenebrio molitor]
MGINRPYSYDDGDEDPELKNFELAPEDFKYKIPYISQAMNLREGGLRLFGSTWTVPKWIKTNGEYVGGYVRKSMYQTWANYFVKFLEEYDKKGIPFWGVTTQNEPSVLMLSKQINSAGWTSMEMSIWIRENLGPALRNSKYSDIKLMILDDQKLWLTWYINAVLSNNKTLDYVDGIAFHWYMGMVAPPSLMVQTHKNYPDLFMLSTEACNGFEADSPATSLGSWRRGEFYSTDIMEVGSTGTWSWTKPEVPPTSAISSIRPS